MTKSSVNKLLNKKVWTGEDVGRALLIRLVDDCRRADQPPSITQADIERMHSSISTPQQREVYNFFSELYDALREVEILQRAYTQMFFHGNCRETSVLTAAMGENVAAGRQLKAPVLMTQEHYEQLKQECIEETKKNIIDYWCAFDNVVYFLEKAPFEIQLAADEYAGEPITNKRVLSFIEEKGWPLEQFNKQNALFSDIFGLYFDWNDEEGLTTEDKFLEFKEDYPLLFDAVDKYLRTFPAFKDITPEEYFKPVTTLLELIEQGFMAADEIRETLNRASAEDVEDLILASDDYSKLYKARTAYAGIAISTRGEETPKDFCLAGEEMLILVAQDVEEAIPAVQMQEYSLKAMYAFNVIIDTLVKCYRLDMLEPLKIDVQELEEDVEKNNSLTASLSSSVYGTEEEKAQKKQIYETAFPPINVEELKPAADRIEALEKYLSGAIFSTGSALVKRNAIVRYMLYLMGEKEGFTYAKEEER